MWKDKGLQLVILPTENKVNVLRGYADRSLLFRYQENYQILESEGDLTCYYYLYLLSDEEIKEGDWCLETMAINSIFQYSGNSRKSYNDSDVVLLFDSKGNNHNLKHSKKIIAATNPSLNLPQPPPSFLEEYAKRYNSKQPMEIEVEYRLNSDTGNNVMEWEELVLNSDNTISIRFKEEKMYSRSEVVELCSKAFSAGEAYRTGSCEGFKQIHLDKHDWLKENLK